MRTLPNSMFTNLPDQIRLCVTLKSRKIEWISINLSDIVNERIVCFRGDNNRIQSVKLTAVKNGNEIIGCTAKAI